jgi:hypothetical protein
MNVTGTGKSPNDLDRNGLARQQLGDARGSRHAVEDHQLIIGHPQDKYSWQTRYRFSESRNLSLELKRIRARIARWRQA